MGQHGFGPLAGQVTLHLGEGTCHRDSIVFKGTMMTKCVECGRDLPDGPTEFERRIPCPYCGSRRRAFATSFEESIDVSAQIQAEQKREGRTVAYRESERDGRAASADDHGTGTTSMTLLTRA
jgi:DNA-directed RNA polymerase subunit RPC12/RpoP